MEDFFVLVNFIKDMITREHPARILEVSGGGSKYGHMLRVYQEHFGIAGGVVDRIALDESEDVCGDTAYGKVFGEEYIDNAATLDTYDFVLMLDIPECVEPERIRALLDTLQYKITKQILILTPVESEAGFRKYHPVFFMGLDFSYSLVQGLSKAIQAFSVFPKIKYEMASIDLLPEADTVETMNIAFALPHHSLTGGLKALLQQIQYLTKIGHNVSVYIRSNYATSAFPPWSTLTDKDCAKQVVIPTSERFLTHIKDADIIILGGIDQAAEFAVSTVPVVLWEQGSGPMFGEFDKHLHSTALERRSLHALYRLPIHLLAVSDIIASALKGIYSRDAFVYPNGIDTEFYHPLETEDGSVPADKGNDIPIVLLTGHPALAFKGFRFAFDALHRAYIGGAQFRVKWAAQVKVVHGRTAFPLEVIISPEQHELAEMYRSADILLSTSLYESYALPPLEAMASGTAVIATDCGGIRTYAKDGENCILCRQGDLSAAIEAIITLVNDKEKRHRLAKAGRETALLHSAGGVVERLSRRLFSIVQHNRQKREADANTASV